MISLKGLRCRDPRSRYTRAAYLHVCTQCTHRGLKERAGCKGRMGKGRKRQTGRQEGQRGRTLAGRKCDEEQGRRSKRGKGQSVDALEVRAYLLSRRNVHILSLSRSLFVPLIRRFRRLLPACRQELARPMSISLSLCHSWNIYIRTRTHSAHKHTYVCRYVQHEARTHHTHIHTRTHTCTGVHIAMPVAHVPLFFFFFFSLAGFLREIKHGHKIKYAGSVYVYAKLIIKRFEASMTVEHDENKQSRMKGLTRGQGGGGERRERKHEHGHENEQHERWDACVNIYEVHARDALKRARCRRTSRY